MLSDFMLAGKQFCGADWVDLKKKYHALDDEDFPRYCFSSAYIVALLHDSLGISLDNDRYSVWLIYPPIFIWDHMLIWNFFFCLAFRVIPHFKIICLYSRLGFRSFQSLLVSGNFVKFAPGGLLGFYARFEISPYTDISAQPQYC